MRPRVNSTGENFAQFWTVFQPSDSQYFVVDRVTLEQVTDYAKRKGDSVNDTERWLAPILDYDPE